jgi:PBSX family phage terminase large subunit
MDKLDFNPKLFNNLYWHLLNYFSDANFRFIWVYGGSSSSKTFSVVQLLTVLMLSSEGENVLILRKFATDIRDSIFADFKGVISSWGLNDFFIIQQNYIVCIPTGSFIRFRGLDDSEKVKGISQFKRVVLEEISQFDELDFKQIKKRLRGRVGQQIVGIFNPISEQHWIKENVFDKEVLTNIETNICETQINSAGDTVILKTNYLDNKYIVGEWSDDGQQIGGFVDTHVIADFEKDKINDFNYYQIYGLGNWGKLRTGGEFWKDFQTDKHVTKTAWNENLPIHLTWDENVNPHITCLVWQIDGKVATQIDEICLPDPRNRVLDACNEFKQRYPSGRVKGLFIYGDRTSIKEDTKLAKGENFYTKIQQHLIEYSPRLRMQSVNPSVVQSGAFINEIYRNNFENITIFVNDNCKKSLFDYQYSLEDSDGTIKKSKKTNPITKVSFEEFGHCSDCLRYFITVAFADEYQNYLRGGRKSTISIGRNRNKSGY